MLNPGIFNLPVRSRPPTAHPLPPSSGDAEVVPGSILLVDDHPITRQGLKAVIEQNSDLRICGEADTASRAVELVEQLRPDLAIIDIGLKTSNGIELTKNLKVLAPNLRMLVL